MFGKILIANRGEIAVRICRTAHKMGISTLAIYADDDQASEHVGAAHEAVSLGTGELSNTYLNTAKIIEIAQKYECDAVHPGYGFLSENPLFVQACEEADIAFIGPSSEAIRLMGNKIAARRFASNAGVPVTEGFSGTQDEILAQAADLPFPLLVKAAAGGGGKGMRIVNASEELEAAITTTSREAATYFGDNAVYVEQYVSDPRHIEVQILGDQHGRIIHLYERECSLQRRYQKIIEEAPSPTLDGALREQICASAVSLAQAIPYTNAGTIEFLLDQNQRFYFLEMNTRIQVEHPVTEMTTGIDLVAEQIRIAAGKPLAYQQSDIKQRGHAIECRVYAETPENNFLPSPGKINYLHLPQLSHKVRLDTYIAGPSSIQSAYDPMIAKLITYEAQREQARQSAMAALKDFAIHGIDTNISYLIGLLTEADFVDNTISTNYCDEHTPQLLKNMQSAKEEISHKAVAAAGLAYDLSAQGALADHTTSIWQDLRYWRVYPKIKYQVDQQAGEVEVWRQATTEYKLTWGGTSAVLTIMDISDGKIVYTLDDHSYTAYVSEDEQFTISLEGFIFSFGRYDRLSEKQVEASEGEQDSLDQLKSPMPGKVLVLNVKVGDSVKKGDVLLVVEAMKMENNIVASRDATVAEVYVAEDDKVDRNMPLIQLG